MEDRNLDLVPRSEETGDEQIALDTTTATCSPFNSIENFFPITPAAIRSFPPARHGWTSRTAPWFPAKSAGICALLA